MILKDWAAVCGGLSFRSPCQAWHCWVRLPQSVTLASMVAASSAGLVLMGFASMCSLLYKTFWARTSRSFLNMAELSYQGFVLFRTVYKCSLSNSSLIQFVADRAHRLSYDEWCNLDGIIEVVDRVLSKVFDGFATFKVLKPVFVYFLSKRVCLDLIKRPFPMVSYITGKIPFFPSDYCKYTLPNLLWRAFGIAFNRL